MKSPLNESWSPQNLKASCLIRLFCKHRQQMLLWGSSWGLSPCLFVCSFLSSQRKLLQGPVWFLSAVWAGILILEKDGCFVSVCWRKDVSFVYAHFVCMSMCKFGGMQKSWERFGIHLTAPEFTWQPQPLPTAPLLLLSPSPSSEKVMYCHRFKTQL